MSLLVPFDDVSNSRAFFLPSLIILFNPFFLLSSSDFTDDPHVHIECNSDNIMLTINTPHHFNGMIYPKGLSKNSSCIIEFNSHQNVTYELPLRSCNTMSTDTVSGLFWFYPLHLFYSFYFMSEEREREREYI